MLFDSHSIDHFSYIIDGYNGRLAHLKNTNSVYMASAPTRLTIMTRLPLNSPPPREFIIYLKYKILKSTPIIQAYKWPRMMLTQAEYLLCVAI